MNANCNDRPPFRVRELTPHDRALLERIYTLARRIGEINKSGKDWRTTGLLDACDPKELQAFGYATQARAETSALVREYIEVFRGGPLTVFLGWVQLAFLPDANAVHKSTCAAYAQQLSASLSAMFLDDLAAPRSMSHTHGR